MNTLVMKNSGDQVFTLYAIREYFSEEDYMMLFNLDIVYLSLERNSLSTRELVWIANGLKRDKTLVEVNLSYNLISDKAATNLGRMLCVNTTLRKLVLCDCMHITDDIESMCEGLAFNTTLVEICMQRNSIMENGARIIGSMLKLNKGLRKLNLRSNLITARGMQFIVEALMINNTLCDIDFGANHVGITRDTGMEKSFSKMLEENKTLNRIVLENCSLFLADLGLMFKGLAANSTLLEIDLRSNLMTDQQIAALSRALKKNKSIKTLLLGSNMFTDEGLAHIVDALRENGTLEKLDLSDERYVTTCAGLIGDLIATNKHILDMSVTLPYTSDLDCYKPIFDGLAVNPVLRVVRRLFEFLSAKDMACLRASIEHNYSVSKIDVPSEYKDIILPITTRNKGFCQIRGASFDVPSDIHLQSKLVFYSVSMSQFYSVIAKVDKQKVTAVVVFGGDALDGQEEHITKKMTIK